MAEKLWTVQDVADFLGLHPKTVYRWAGSGEGPPGIRLGKYVRFKPADVEAWLEAHRQELNGTS